MRQISINDWPTDLTEEIAVISMSPEEFEKRMGITFEEDWDDLDYFKATIISEDAVLFALKRYRNSPGSGSTLWVPTGSKDQLRQSIADALRILSLENSILKWVRPDVSK